MESEDFDKLLDEESRAKAGLYEAAITNEAFPVREDQLMKESAAENSVEEESANLPGSAFANQLKTVSGVDDTELFRKRMYLEKPFVDLMEFMLEDTLFNLMEEATYEEFDLGQPPKIYIRKEAQN